MGGFKEWYQGNDNAFLHDGNFNPDGVKSYVCVERIEYGSDSRSYYIGDPSKPYGDRERRVIKSIFNAIHNRTRTVPCNNSLFEVNDSNDPARGQRKKANIRYRMHPNGPLLSQTAYEYEDFNFFQHCLLITYGGADIMNSPDIYERFNRALKDGLGRTGKTTKGFFSSSDFGDDAVVVNNSNMGDDPRPGVKKRVNVVFEIFGEQVRSLSASEYDKWPSTYELKHALGQFSKWIQGPPLW